MGGEETRPMWYHHRYQIIHLLLLVVFFAGAGSAICPSRCQCNEDALRVSCVNASLAVVPIQLNPEVLHIDLSGNKISNVLFTLSFYDKLISLDLSTNKISTLGSGNFETQRSMKHLNLSRNDISALSKGSFKGLKVLHVLDLSYNRLENISEAAFRDLHSLEVLSLTGNQLVHLEVGLLKPAKELKQLLLEGNQLLRVPRAIEDAPSLQLLTLSNNLINLIEEADVPALGELQTLLLDSNIIGNIAPGALSGLTSLDVLDLSNNNFTSVPTASLAKLANLTSLKFSANCIAAVPPVAFRGLFQLRTLFLDKQDFLTHIDSRAFVDNIHLEHVLLDDNIALERLPHRLFHGNPHLERISVRNNRISTLDASHFPLDQLQKLMLGGNPFFCNCSLLWLWRLATEQTLLTLSNNSIPAHDLFLDVEDVYCSGPEPLSGAVLLDASESQIGCSLGWLAVGGGIAFTFLMLFIAIAVLYCTHAKRELQGRDLESVPQAALHLNGGGNHHLHRHHQYETSHIYEDPKMDKYIMGPPPVIHDYHALPPPPPWEPCPNDVQRTVYKQFDNTVKTRPHIVYV